MRDGGEVQMLPDLDVGVASNHSVQQLLRGAHGGDFGGALQQGAEGTPLLSSLHGTLARWTPFVPHAFAQGRKCTLFKVVTLL
jgi:hypothetical protein